jgi:hypothetical protein
LAEKDQLGNWLNATVATQKTDAEKKSNFSQLKETKMSKNRFLLVLSLLSLLSVAMAVSLTRLDAPSSKDLRWLPRPVIAPSMSGVYPNAEEVRPVRPYIMDSATRSYIAWGQAMQVRNAIDSGTRSYIAWFRRLLKHDSGKHLCWDRQQP